VPNRNEEVATLLDDIGELLSLTRTSPFRVRAYTRAARAIRALSINIDEMHHAGQLTDITGVGESLAEKIGEYLDTGRSSYYDELKGKVPRAEVDLLEVPGVGPVRARQIYERLGVRDAEGLVRAAREHKLAEVPGVSGKLEERIGREAARSIQRSKRMLLDVALPAAEDIAAALRKVGAVLRAEPAGSIRRMQETIGDIDILVASDRPSDVQHAFTRLPVVSEILWQGEGKTSILTNKGLQVDIRVLAPDEYGSGLLYFTGSKAHNIALRLLAIREGLKLSEYGLFDSDGRRIASRTEEEIYKRLGLDWIPPELRNDSGEIDAAREHELPALVSIGNIKGDLHSHTDWSDGRDTAEHMVQAAIAKGYEYLAVTDHSRSLRIAPGLSVERVAEQRKLIDQLNHAFSPFRVLHGSEVDILPGGSLDYPDAVLAEFDFVVASVHRSFKLPREQQTQRIIRALEHPAVDVLGHPSGRLLDRRDAYDVDLDAVIHAAKERGVALEIDGQPDRLDLDDTWSRRASEAGALVACDSDAHAVGQLDYVRYAVSVARRGWVSADSVLNARPLGALLDHLRRNRGAASP
jgi:DNA polymerase (family X)